MKDKEMLIIFKTHLDIGFTNYAENIISDYINVYIPNAIRVGYELKDTDTPFIWTVGSWLIDQALKTDQDGLVDKAIRDGILNWHGLPFTTHTELMNPKLFCYGLEISKRLDARYSRRTIAAKMTDVPGHTIGIVPYMRRAGLQFMHIGINTATPIPPVPPLFRWKCGEDDIVVMYQGDYGEIMELSDFAVCFAHTADNMGPQSGAEVAAIYQQLHEKYPEYTLKAATLNDLALRACAVPNLPILENEIGDTWIHGVATDPQKISRYRRILRELGDKEIAGVDLTDSLLLVPEHTWGMDVKTFFHDDSHYSHQDMEKLSGERKTIEKSWQEQRDFVRKAEECLSMTSEYPIEEPSTDGYHRVDDTQSDISLIWQIFDRSDYTRYQADYMRLTEENRDWALWDFTKVGLPGFQGASYCAHVVAHYQRDDEHLYKLAFCDQATKTYGLPFFWLYRKGGAVTLKWFGKKASRLPQACYLKFTGFQEQWALHKMGQWIYPESVVGSPLLHAVQRGVRNDEYLIETLDSPLVAPFGRKLLHYADRGNTQDMHFILYNNIWNTNFPMWYSDDAMFRFVIRRRDS